MRKTLGLLAALALVAAPLVATPLDAAHAGSTRYKVSASVSDDKLDLTSHDGSNRSTRIRGKVTGGPVKGRKVGIYARNVSTKAAKRHYLGSARLSSTGRFSWTWRPRDGGRYEIDVVKKAGSGKAGGSDPTRVYVFQFVSLKYLYDKAASSGAGYVDREKFGNGTYYRDGYHVNGGGRAVFDITGFHCMRFNFKTGLSLKSEASRGTVRARQATTHVAREMKAGEVYKATSTVQKKLTATGRLIFSVDRRDDIDDQSRLRFVIGRPVAACTYPTDSEPFR